MHALPVSLQREALDYIAFLESRYGIRPVEQVALDDLTTETFIARHAGALGDDFPEDVDFAEGCLPDATRDVL